MAGALAVSHARLAHARERQHGAIDMVMDRHFAFRRVQKVETTDTLRGGGQP